jgi:hypothetical protein
MLGHDNLGTLVLQPLQDQRGSLGDHFTVFDRPNEPSLYINRKDRCPMPIQFYHMHSINHALEHDID